MVSWKEDEFGSFWTVQVGNKKQLMPDGYMLMWNDDGLYWWQHKDTEQEGLNSWDKWWVRRCAILNSKERNKKG